MYFSISTKPDISYAVGNLKFLSKPTKIHWMALKCVLCYLKGTMNYRISYKKEESNDCVGFSDADRAEDINDRKSTSGYLFQISGGAVSWRSKKQECVALSTAEAEYVALSSAVQESIWLRKLIAELGSPNGPTTIFEDNQSAIAMCKNPQHHGRVKHIDIKHHIICEQVANKNVKLEYCPTKVMTADIFTKGLTREQFYALRSKAGIIAKFKRRGVLYKYLKLHLFIYVNVLLLNYCYSCLFRFCYSCYPVTI